MLRCPRTLDCGSTGALYSTGERIAHKAGKLYPSTCTERQMALVNTPAPNPAAPPEPK
jgi:hypothetical protein